MTTHQRKQLKKANELMRKIQTYQAVLNRHKREEIKNDMDIMIIESIEKTIKRYQMEFDAIIEPN